VFKFAGGNLWSENGTLVFGLNVTSLANFLHGQQGQRKMVCHARYLLLVLPFYGYNWGTWGGGGRTVLPDGCLAPSYVTVPVIKAKNTEARQQRVMQIQPQKCGLT
jgi:hypothetical protein